MNARLISCMGQTVADVVVPQSRSRSYPAIIKLGDRHFAFGDFMKIDPDGRPFFVYREAGIYVVPEAKAAAA